jgi:hypothetical protein
VGKLSKKERHRETVSEKMFSPYIKIKNPIKPTSRLTLFFSLSLNNAHTGYGTRCMAKAKAKAKDKEPLEYRRPTDYFLCLFIVFFLHFVSFFSSHRKKELFSFSISSCSNCCCCIIFSRRTAECDKLSVREKK